MSEGVHHDLLAEPSWSVRLEGGAAARLTLPQVLEALGEDRIASFEALQVHQEQAWYCFLVQLAALALHRAGEEEPRGDAATWEGRLLALTAGAREPWALVVDDLSRPAFMQPPVPEGTLDGFKADKSTAAELDLLMTAKNHDVKIGRVASAAVEHWVYALLALQTLEGYGGRSNYGIARMNGGVASRPWVGLVPSLRWGSRFARDVGVLFRSREEVIADLGFAAAGGAALLWLLPWNGEATSSIPLVQCDPWFIEVCRRRRFALRGDALMCWEVGTNAARISAAEARGVTGDPWTPVHVGKETKALNVGGDGFTYDRIRQLLAQEDFRPGAAQAPDPQRAGAELLLTHAMARGQGKTEGLHRRLVPIPERARRLLMSAGGRAQLGHLAKERVDEAGKVQRKVLWPALQTLRKAGEDTRGTVNVDRFTAAFDDAVDQRFFPALWEALEGDEGTGRVEWLRTLRELAQEQLTLAMESVPYPSARRYRAMSAAEAIFNSNCRKHLARLYDEAEPPQQEEMIP